MRLFKDFQLVQKKENTEKQLTLTFGEEDLDEPFTIINSLIKSINLI